MIKLNMENIKEVISNNILSLRKQKGLTQLELGEIIHYSDKAISRWEKGESLPDVETLQLLSETLGVPLSYLFEEHNKDEALPVNTNKKINKIICTALSTLIVWLVAVVIFLYCRIYNHTTFWQIFIWSVPASCIVLWYFNKIWGKKSNNLYIDSLFIWSLIVSLYCQFISYNLWLIFFLGLLIEVVLILSHFVKTLRNPKNIKNGDIEDVTQNK